MGVGPAARRARRRARLRKSLVRALVRHAQGRRRTRQIARLSRWFTDEELQAIEAQARRVAKAAVVAED